LKPAAFDRVVAKALANQIEQTAVGGHHGEFQHALQD
jgi:hypothetical protein